MAKQHSKSILCIGNDPIHLNLRCSQLRKQGWNVLSAGSGYDGVMRFTKESVDAVVVDLNQDGAEAALITGELRRLRPEVPVIILALDADLLAQGATQLANAVVMKSQGDRGLIDALKTLLPAK